MIPLGTIVPDLIYLMWSQGGTFLQNNMRGKISVVMFICNHCPFVKHVNDQLVKLATDYIPRGVKFIAISSNDVGGYPEDSPEKMKETTRQLFQYPFPYLYDETQAVAKAFDAACTADFYIFNKNGALVYRTT